MVTFIGEWIPVGMGDCGFIAVIGNNKVHSMILEVNGGGRVKHKVTGEDKKTNEQKKKKNKKTNKKRKMEFADWMR